MGIVIDLSGVQSLLSQSLLSPAFTKNFEDSLQINLLLLIECLNLLDEEIVGRVKLLSEMNAALSALFGLEALRLVASGIVDLLQDHPQLSPIL